MERRCRLGWNEIVVNATAETNLSHMEGFARLASVNTIDISRGSQGGKNACLMSRSGHALVTLASRRGAIVRARIKKIRRPFEKYIEAAYPAASPRIAG